VTGKLVPNQRNRPRDDMWRLEMRHDKIGSTDLQLPPLTTVFIRVADKWALWSLVEVSPTVLRWFFLGCGPFDPYDVNVASPDFCKVCFLTIWVCLLFVLLIPYMHKNL
jgi:hypothetical protein